MASSMRVTRSRSRLAQQVQNVTPEYENDEPILEDNVDPYEVVASRSQPRVSGKVCIEVKLANSDTIEKWPIKAFIDEEGFFTNDTVCKWIYDWNNKARKTPYAPRKCLFCNRKAKRAVTLCGHCENEGWRDIVYA